MKFYRFKGGLRIYPIIWSFLALGAIYLLIRFLTISFSDQIGQAKEDLAGAMISNISIRVMEAGSSLISYYSNAEETYAFPVGMVSDRLEVARFAKKESYITEKAQEASLSLKQQFNNSIQSEGNIITSDQVNTNRIGGIGFRNVTSGHLSKEYVLTNGAIYNGSELFTQLLKSNNLQIGYIGGLLQIEESEDDTDPEEAKASIETTGTNQNLMFTMKQLEDINFLVRNFYIVDRSTKVTDSLFDAEVFLSKDMTMKQTNDEPQILIFHTHSQEAYIDSRPGAEEDTVVGVGDYLTEILTKQYGYHVIHHTSKYDYVDGRVNRNQAYTRAEAGLEKVLEENPTIEVIIDLHRDEGAKRVTEINGKEYANIMLFNGLSRDQNGPITYLDNPNLQDNLAFSFQLQLKAKELYPDLFFKNYLKNYRFNMHFRPKYLLVELGTVNNTLQEAVNSMEPFAEILDQVLQGSDQDVNATLE